MSTQLHVEIYSHDSSDVMFFPLVRNAAKHLFNLTEKKEGLHPELEQKSIFAA